MNQIDRLFEIVTTYRKFGWSLRRVLLTPETASSCSEREQALFADTTVVGSTIDALWFSRPSHEKREAWELRLVSETAYALFETFESDETEEQREELRQEMEARMREVLTRDDANSPAVPD
jgi:hypothetical protein